MTDCLSMTEYCQYFNRACFAYNPYLCCKGADFFAIPHSIVLQAKKRIREGASKQSPATLLPHLAITQNPIMRGAATPIAGVSVYSVHV
jgi:hypothetical protein